MLCKILRSAAKNGSPNRFFNALVRIPNFKLPFKKRQDNSYRFFWRKVRDSLRGATQLSTRTNLSGSLLVRRERIRNNFSFALAITPGQQTQHCCVWRQTV